MSTAGREGGVGAPGAAPNAPEESFQLARQASVVARTPGTWAHDPLVPHPELHPADKHVAWKQRAHDILESHRMHILILVLVLIDVSLVMAEIFVELFTLQSCLDNEGPFPFEPAHGIHVTEEVLRWASVAILSVFVAELIAKLIVFRFTYFTKSFFHLFDAVVILLAFFSTIFLHGASESIVAFFIFLRLWRIARIIDGVAVTIELEGEGRHNRYAQRIKALKAEIESLKAERARLSQSNGDNAHGGHGRGSVDDTDVDLTIHHENDQEAESQKRHAKQLHAKLHDDAPTFHIVEPPQHANK